MMDEVMYEIREMTGQSYVNAYSGATDDERPSRVATVEAVAAPAVRELVTSSC